MRKLWISGAALVLAGSALAAQAEVGRMQPGGDETRAQAQTRAEHLFDRLDLNHDGKLDEADRRLRIMQHFDQIETNHDGMISRDEFLAAHMHHGMGEGAMEMGEPGEHHRGMHMARMWMIMQQADPDHTGVITRDAFVHAALALFDRADTNHDGVLTPQERRAAMRQWHTHMGMMQDAPGAMPPAGGGQ